MIVAGDMRDYIQGQTAGALAADEVTLKKGDPRDVAASVGNASQQRDGPFDRDESGGGGRRPGSGRARSISSVCSGPRSCIGFRARGRGEIFLAQTGSCGEEHRREQDRQRHQQSVRQQPRDIRAGNPLKHRRQYTTRGAAAARGRHCAANRSSATSQPVLVNRTVRPRS